MMNLEIEKKNKFNELENGTMFKVVSEDECVNGKIAMKTSGIFTKRIEGEEVHLDEVEAVMVGEDGYWNSFDCSFELLTEGDKILIK